MIGIKAGFKRVQRETTIFTKTERTCHATQHQRTDSWSGGSIGVGGCGGRSAGRWGRFWLLRFGVHGLLHLPSFLAEQIQKPMMQRIDITSRTSHKRSLAIAPNHLQNSAFGQRYSSECRNKRKEGVCPSRSSCYCTGPLMWFAWTNESVDFHPLPQENYPDHWHRAV